MLLLLLLLLLFFIKNLCFYNFHFFFFIKYQISTTKYKPITNRIGDKKMSVELYVTGIITKVTSNDQYRSRGIMGYKFVTVRFFCISYECKNLEPQFKKLAGGFIMFSTHRW